MFFNFILNALTVYPIGRDPIIKRQTYAIQGKGAAFEHSSQHLSCIIHPEDEGNVTKHLTQLIFQHHC
jgi:hypothetical protein